MQTIIVNKPIVFPPTRRCLICECRENPKAEIVDAGKAWLCERCKEALIKVVEKESKQ
jgi:hypothetical protein